METIAQHYAAPALVTVLALILYVVLAFKVGQARGKYGIKPPAISGHEVFDRVYRVQMNTLEQLVFFLPSLWLFAVFQDAPLTASMLGSVWIAARILYAQGYYREAKKRMLGFILSLTASSILLLGALGGIVSQLLGSPVH